MKQLRSHVTGTSGTGIWFLVRSQPTGDSGRGVGRTVCAEADVFVIAVNLLSCSTPSAKLGLERLWAAIPAIGHAVDLTRSDDLPAAPLC